MKTSRLLSMISLLQIGLMVYSTGALAQERLLEKIKERRQERREGIKDKLANKDISGSADKSFKIMHDGLLREYKVHLPENYNKNLPAPVVIFLHGGGGSMKEAYSEGMDKMSDKYGFILAIPQGTGKKILGKIIGSWNSGNWSGSKKLTPISCCGYAGDNNIDDVGFISKMIDEIKSNFSVDEKKIYATGMSNGAMMSYRLACELSNKIAAVAVVAPPFVPEVCDNAKPISIMDIHGTADPCALYNGGFCENCLGKSLSTQSAKEIVNSWIMRDGCLSESEIIYNKGNAKCVDYSKCAQGTEVEFCTIEGGGHTWPSGNQYLPAEKIGPVSNDMSFDQMWEFLKKHSLSE